MAETPLDDVAERLDAALDRPVEPGTVDEVLMQKVAVPYKLIRKYCRVQVEGIENLPAAGAVLACNHTGWLGLDYANLAVVVHDKTGRFVRGVVHPAWFKNDTIGRFASRLGLAQANKDNIVQMAESGKLVVVFPEAEHGAFKDARKAKYKLMEFKRGFVRAAMGAQVPIVPVAIVGGEEANPSLGELELTDRLFRIPLPRPANILPRPVKWRISIMEPVPMDEYRPEDASEPDEVYRLCDEIRDAIQDEIDVQLEKRGSAYL